MNEVLEPGCNSEGLKVLFAPTLVPRENGIAETQVSPIETGSFSSKRGRTMWCGPRQSKSKKGDQGLPRPLCPAAISL